MPDTTNRATDWLKPLINPMIMNELSTSLREGADGYHLEVPSTLPILPLRGLVIYPMTAVPIRVGQPRSVQLVDDAVSDGNIIGLVASHDPEIETPTPEQVYRVGTAAAVHRLAKAPDGTLTLIVQGLVRIRIEEFIQESPYFLARVEAIPETTEPTMQTEALRRGMLQHFRRLIDLSPGIPEEMGEMLAGIEDPLQTTYAIANHIESELEEAQEILEMDHLVDKMHRLLNMMAQEVEVLELGRKIKSEAQSEMQQRQREYFLREQQKAIQRELGEGDEQMEAEEFRKKIEELGMPEEAEQEARRELDRLTKVPSASPEYGVIRTYLDWLTTLPWDVETEDNLDIGHARSVLDEDHYDLEDIKERILEYLAVRKLRDERKEELKAREPEDCIRREREGVILCFVGPPGTGKTSLGQSIARALGRRFIRQSLGGVRDEAEIRGHRRTYIGALPGRVVQAIRRVGSKNPVFMIDEVDKLGKDFRGDPASALLEVLDPEQNSEFRDHYLDVPFDLSRVMFITTANLLEPIPEPLRDRMEILRLSGYTETEKVRIAQGYLIPRQLRENGLWTEELSFEEEALRKIIRDYTREAGVRNLEREIGKVCRKVVTRVAEGETEAVEVTPDNLSDFIGRRRYFPDTAMRTQIPGVATGLGVTVAGGDLLFCEATKMAGDKGFTVTGQLGDVMKESAQAALSYIRSKAPDLGISEDIFSKVDIHVHVPKGAIPKDGPSAGVTIATALASLLSNRRVRGDVGMTGEITLRGQVLPVGGVKMKVLTAHRAGLETVILPMQNDKDLEDVPKEVLDELEIVLVERIDEVFDVALEPPGAPEGEAC